MKNQSKITKLNPTDIGKIANSCSAQGHVDSLNIRPYIAPIPNPGIFPNGFPYGYPNSYPYKVPYDDVAGEYKKKDFLGIIYRKTA